MNQFLAILTPPAIRLLGSADAEQPRQARLFCDEYGVAFAYFYWPKPRPHFECLPIKSRQFRQRLYSASRTTPMAMSASGLRQFVEDLELEAGAAKSTSLANRVAMAGGDIFVDLGDDCWTMIRVTRDGYRLVRQRKPRFYRAKHQQPLPKPVQGGSPWEIFNYLAVNDEADKLLVLTWILAAFYPATPIPILLAIGSPGSAKTTNCKRIRILIDPSSVPVLDDPTNRDCLQIFYHHAVPCFENVGHFSRKRADMLCRAVTGSGVERRRLYSDTDAVIFAFRRPILLNGTDIPSTRPDFLDRCLILQGKRMETFQSLKSLDAQYEQARPRLLGAILDLLVKTLALLGSTPSTGEFRMADFAHFGRAVAMALGKTPADFDAAYRANLGEQSHELVEDCPFARAVKELAKVYCKDDPWEGNPTKMLTHAIAAAKKHKISTTGSAWPKSARWASTRLTELTSVLRSERVIVERLSRKNDGRPWRIYSVEEANTASPSGQ